jgi:RNA polymerase sigma factor (sigma-70 family)
MLGASVGGEVEPRTVASAAQGDAAALAAIVARHHDDMARVCAVICSDPQLAEDAVQSAWPIAWRRLGTLRDPQRLRPWLIAIAVNEARQIQRRERRRQVVEIRVAPLPTHGAHDDAIAVADLGVALRRLSADDRALLAMRYLAGLNSTEIGDTLGITASAVRSRLERLLARLRLELGHE